MLTIYWHTTGCRLFGNRGQKFICQIVILNWALTHLSTCFVDREAGYDLIPEWLKEACLIRLLWPSIWFWVRAGISAQSTSAKLQNNPVMNLVPWAYCCLRTARLSRGEKVGGKNNGMTLPELHCIPESLWLVVSLLPVSEGIISEYQKYLKKLKALKIPYEFDKLQFESDYILPEPQIQIWGLWFCTQLLTMLLIMMFKCWKKNHCYL